MGAIGDLCTNLPVDVTEKCVVDFFFSAFCLF